MLAAVLAKSGTERVEGAATKQSGYPAPASAV